MYSNNKLTLLFRGGAFYIDLMISVAIAMIFNTIVYGELSFDHIYLDIGLAFILLTFRDIFGKSVGKLLLGMSIVDTRDNNKAKIFQRLVKNITTPLSIIEIPMVLLRKDHRRLGEMLAKTETKLDEDSSALSLLNYLIKMAQHKR